MATRAEELIRKSYIQWASELYAAQYEEYEKYERYYDGEHDLPFSTERWKQAFGNEFEEFEDNWCGVVVDAYAQRLEIIGWKANSKALAKKAEEIWDRENVGEEEESVTLQGLIKGDAYLIVQRDPEVTDEGKAQMFYNDAFDVNVHYDPANKKRISRASKKWMTEDNRLRLNIYYPDRIVRYISKRDNFDRLWVPDDDYELDPADIPPEGWIFAGEPLKIDAMPVFHFKNRGAGSTHGMSEIKSVIPVQNGVNKVLMDMFLGSEFAGFPQKWMAGGGHPKDGWRAGAERVWATTDPNAKFGQFDVMELSSPREFVEMLVSHIAKITQTPMHYLRSMGDMPSGEALKTAESGLIHKVKSRQKRWGHVWTQAMKLALQIETGKEVEASADLEPIWKFPETRHDLEQAQTAQLKSILGVPLRQLWSEHFGYTEEQCDEFEKKNLAIAAGVLAQVISQSGQLPPGMDDLSQAGLKPDDVMSLLTTRPNADGSLNLAQILATMSKSTTAQTSAGEATTRPQPNSAPPASPTRRSAGFKD